MKPTKPFHRLNRVEFTLYLPRYDHAVSSEMRAAGYSDTKRAALWHYHEAFDHVLDAEKGYGVGDALHHVALVALQDRPNSLDRLEFALRGGLAWEQAPLF